ncbi:hypothetical protein IVA79_10565 [Bradyrhizobium sp. 138]|uniref:hypothetical protein n=1 Tax=Bradyrhizobium sp. 138 TaxID=2782615 RepID=UPI00320AC9AC|nr:hypothetical protein [Bradyrhizobium sp. 138]
MGGVFRPYDCKLWIPPIEVRPNVSAAASAALTDELWLDIRQPHLIDPAIRVQSNVMAAMAIDQHAANAHRAHLAEGNLHRAAVCVYWRVAFRARHAAIKAGS